MHNHHSGLAHDMATLLETTADRRLVLRWLGAGAATLPLMGCGASISAGPSVESNIQAATTSACPVIPEETAGPYPGDGSNSNATGVANALLLSGIVRSDIRASIAGASAVADGVPLTVKLQLVNTNASCTSLAGYAIYLWHCDRNGNYSMYSAGLTAENYLRGVQETDSNGSLSFTTIFPGCYSGRMPHIHFEVYASLAKAGNVANKIKTSQFTFPLATLKEAYAATGYSASVSNLATVSFATDNVFSDGTTLQMASMSGSAALGYVASLQFAISV